ncbi:MAG: DUF2271 domain-containing protein [Bacteroidales bacterium]|nr:DUF2271 domain-containing protein [Bacteroidales bacterium]
MNLFRTIAFSLICIGFTLPTLAQTQGTLSISVKTVTNNGQYNPKNILAIWVEDASTNSFVKTRLLRSQNTTYRKYLTKFKAATNSTYNVVDAQTGATYPSHSTRTATWDGTDISGNVVLDGDYKVCIEYTESNGTGPFVSFVFNKSDQVITLSPANTSYFQDISIVWTPNVLSLDDFSKDNGSLSVYPNPINKSALVNIVPNVSNIYVIDVHGKIVDRIDKPNTILKSQVIWTPNIRLKNGVYFIVVENNISKLTTKVILQR